VTECDRWGGGGQKKSEKCGCRLWTAPKWVIKWRHAYFDLVLDSLLDCLVVKLKIMLSQITYLLPQRIWMSSRTALSQFNQQFAIHFFILGARTQNLVNGTKLWHTVHYANGLRQGCTTQISWRAKKKFRHIQGPKLISFNPFKDCFYQRNKQTKHNFGFCGPD